MADYSAGNLELDVLGISDKALVSIDKTVKSLNSLSRAITKINQTQFVLAGQKMEILFSKIAKSTNSINTANLSNLSSAAKSLSSLSRIGNLQNVDFDKIGNGFSNLTVAITPFINKVREAENSLSSLHGILQKSSGKKIQGLLGSGGDNKSSSKGFGLLNIAGWTSTLYMARRLGNTVAKIAQSGADYTETLNLWQTAMGDNLNVATQFVNKMNEAYGVSEKTLMNAQAIFKNMLGSLGQISDSMAYSLSEGVTQMALDYASLYNVTFEQAFTKFQAALAGQVRPIRSVAGYDITENTLFQLYQSLGGTKTMRQLSRTEKQLLSILAIFRQMNASGAVGDLDKTMESYANQSRVMAESWQRVMSYSGILLTHTIQQWGILKYINAFLIFLGDTLKAVVDYYGAMESFGDPFEAVTNGAESANDEIDKLQGKLLGFDKFRSMNGAGEGDIGLDSKLLEALSSYETVLAGASMEAQNLARQLGVVTGLFDESGAFNPATWEAIAQGISDCALYLGILVGVMVGNKILGFVSALIDAEKMVKLLETATIALNTALITGIIFSFIKAIQLFQEGNEVGGWLAIALGTLLVGAFLALKFASLDATLSVEGFIKTLVTGVGSHLMAMVAGISLLIAGITSLANAWGDMAGWHQALTIIGAVTAAIIGAYVAFKAFSTSVPVALGIGAALAGGIMLLSSQFKTVEIENRAVGGMVDKGTVFRAGEAGAEIVYNTPTGQSGVANVQQIAQATYNGTIKALNDWWGGSKAKGDIPQLESANPTGMYQAVTGVARSYGQRWSK